MYPTYIDSNNLKRGKGGKRVKNHNVCHIKPDEMLTDELLNNLFEQLDEEGELVIERDPKTFDFNRDSLILVKNGFIHVAEVPAGSLGKVRVLHCVKGKKETPLLSIIVPLYNEENTARTLLEQLFAFDWPMDHEFVIVESNSQDNTRNVVKSYEGRSDVKIVLEDKPSGKGNGVLRGIEEAGGQYIAIQDGDLEYDVKDYAKLLPPLINHETLFMLGSRHRKGDWRMRKFAGEKSWTADYLNVGQKLLTWLLNTACGCKLTDPFTMYKIFHRDCIYGINFKGGNFGLDWEIVIRLVRKGYIPTEIPISYQARSYAEGKHIELFRTPLEGLAALWRCRFASGVYDYGNDVDVDKILNVSEIDAKNGS